jgi:hypothetical protein
MERMRFRNCHFQSFQSTPETPFPETPPVSLPNVIAGHLVYGSEAPEIPKPSDLLPFLRRRREIRKQRKLIYQEGGFYHNFRPLQREYDGPAGGQILTIYRRNGQEMICFVSTDFISSNRMVFWSFPADFKKGSIRPLLRIVRIIFCIPLKKGLTMRRETAK